MRIFTISDLHVDKPENQSWLSRLSGSAYKKDALLVGGDISHDQVLLEASLQALREKFEEVFFVPGNHDLWIQDGEFTTSVEKFERVLEICRAKGTHTQRRKLGEGDLHPAWVLPLFAWYSTPEVSEHSLYQPKPGESGDLSMWSDRRYIHWPEFEEASAAEYFLNYNFGKARPEFDAPLISFSHFLPRRELLFPSSPEEYLGPRKDFYPAFNFSRVAGTSQLEELIRSVGSTIHIHGHQHRNRCREIDGVTYISHCLGYPRERERGVLPVESELPKLIWDTSAGKMV